jgi:DNA gyrase subunit A
LVNLIPFEEGEHAVTFLAVEDYLAEEQLVFCTKFGTVKKTPLKAFANIRANGIRALNIHEGDELIGVERSSGNHELFLATRKGRAIRFDESEVRSMGRSAAGVIGVRLQEDDYVIEMTLVPEGEGEVLTVSANGYGKITSLQEYRQTHRGGMGVMNMKVNEKTGPIAAVKFIHSPSILVMSQFGKLIRMDVSEVRHTGRVTQGVKFIQLDDPQDQVSGMSILLEEENEGGNEP